MRQRDGINVSEWHAGGMPPSEHVDWVIDLGPGGGVNGGRIIAEGPPERIAGVAVSATGQYLRPMLERASVKPVVVETKPKRVARSRKVAVDADEPDLIGAK